MTPLIVIPAKAGTQEKNNLKKQPDKWSNLLGRTIFKIKELSSVKYIQNFIDFLGSRLRGNDDCRVNIFSKKLKEVYLPIFLLFLMHTSPVFADKNPLPRFVSLKSNEINERVGPGPNYPVEWTYVKADLPVEVIAEFDNWRKIRDKDGAEGWVHQSMLSSKRHGIIQGAETLIYSAEDINSRPLVRLEPGVLVEILKCRGNWCQVRVFDFKGWVQRSFLWGIYPQEVIG